MYVVPADMQQPLESAEVARLIELARVDDLQVDCAVNTHGVL